MTSEEIAKRVYSDDQIASFKSRGIWESVAASAGMAYNIGYIDAMKEFRDKFLQEVDK